MTPDNIIWMQSVLESIFDIDHLSPKIDSDIVDAWMDAIKRDRQVRSHVNYVILFFFVILLNIYFYLG